MRPYRNEQFVCDIPWEFNLASTTCWVSVDGSVSALASALEQHSTGWVTITLTAEEMDADEVVGELVAGTARQAFRIVPNQREMLASDLTTLHDTLEDVVSSVEGSAYPSVDDIAQAIWEYAERALDGYNDVAEAVWSAVSRTLTEKTGISLTETYDGALTAGQEATALAIERASW